MELINGNCLEVMPQLESESIDLICADLPYGILCKSKAIWDRIIPMEPLWEQYRRLIKPTGCIALFSAQPFTTDLINAARDIFRYEIIMAKTNHTAFLNANCRPLAGHENILIFSKAGTSPSAKTRMKYFPQKIQVERKRNERAIIRQKDYVYGKATPFPYYDDGTRHPSTVIVSRMPSSGRSHSSSKPQNVLEFLIKSYTEEGDTVLDNAMGGVVVA